MVTIEKKVRQTRSLLLKREMQAEGCPVPVGYMTAKNLEEHFNNWRTGKGLPISIPSEMEAAAIEKPETDEEVCVRINKRFDILGKITRSTLVGSSRAMIVSGPPGLGKSYSVEQMLRDECEGKFATVKGYVRATGLYKVLYENREENDIVVFDDADSIFNDDTCLNFLKAACDTTEERVLTYAAETVLYSEKEQANIPNEFEFKGRIIFITNVDFVALIDRGHRLAEHLSALINRAHYVDLSLKSRRDFVIRIEQVAATGRLKHLKSKDARNEVLGFIREHRDSLIDLSIRTAIKIGGLYHEDADWKETALVTCCRN